MGKKAQGCWTSTKENKMPAFTSLGVEEGSLAKGDEGPHFQSVKDKKGGDSCERSFKRQEEQNVGKCKMCWGNQMEEKILGV